MTRPRQTASNPVPLSEQTVAYLEFFRRWDTPLDDRATVFFSGIVRRSLDFETFQTLAPVGSEERALFTRHLASFEEAATLIRAGRMREDLFFDAWYAMPAAWNKAKPYVLGMRAEGHAPLLYEAFEWLARRAEQFWAEREKNPPTWQPVSDQETSIEERAIFAAFQEIWATPRDAVGRAFFAELTQRAPDFETFLQIVPPGSEEFIKFDRVLCAYDQAGTLIKNGILHPALFFAAWRSPGEVWAAAGPWVKGLRQSRNVPHLYDNVDWLVAYEAQWRLP